MIRIHIGIRQEVHGFKIGKVSNEDIEIFNGKDNLISMSRVYSMKFFCEYDMQWFPFDQQVFHIQLIMMDGFLENYVAPVARNIKYFVEQFSMERKTINCKEAVVASITVGGRLVGIFLTVCFPTALLNVVGYATNLFKAFSLRFNLLGSL